MMQKHHLKVSSLCEVGCGAGGILDTLQQSLPKTVNLFGYEISPQAFELAQTRTNERLHFFCDDLLTRNTQPYDLVLCIDVFEHVEDYLGFLRSLRRHGQKFIFHIPLDMSVQLLIRSHRLLFLREQVGHLHYFTKDTAVATLQDAGYKVKDIVFTAGILELQRNEGVGTKLLRLPRKFLSAISPSAAAKILGGYSLLVLAETDVTSQQANL